MGVIGGYILKINISIVQGVVWQVVLSNFGSVFGVGYLVMVLFFQDGVIVNEYFYCNVVLGYFEFNWMNMVLNMGGNNIVVVGVIIVSGNIMISVDISVCNVIVIGMVKVGIVDVVGEIYIGGWFRICGNLGWYNEWWDGGWYMSDSIWVRLWMNKSVYIGGELRGGKFSFEGRMIVGEYFQINGLVVENVGCFFNGLVGRDNSGFLFCIDGLWKWFSGVNIVIFVVLVQYFVDN